MAKHKKKNMMNIPICIAGILLCLTLISLHFMGGLYARYKTSGSGNDSARVASFNISQEFLDNNGAVMSDDITFNMAPAPEGTPAYAAAIKVDNSSEVAVAYTITAVNTTDNLPLKLQISDSEITLDTCTFTSNLAPNTLENEIPFYIYWTPENSLQYRGMVDHIDISITAVQID